jgi:hypothetical protein
MITEELYSFLITRTAITAIVPVGSIQLAPLDFTVASFPCLSFETQNEQNENCLDGLNSLVNESVVFRCADKSPGAAKTLAKTVKEDLEGYIGLVGTSFYVTWCYTASASDGFDHDSGANYIDLNFTIWHRPA